MFVQKIIVNGLPEYSYWTFFSGVPTGFLLDALGGYGSGTFDYSDQPLNAGMYEHASPAGVITQNAPIINIFNIDDALVIGNTVPYSFTVVGFIK